MRGDARPHGSWPRQGHTRSTNHSPTMNIDDTIDRTIELKRQIAALQAELDHCLDLLQAAVELGDLDPQFSHQDVAFSLSSGRTSYTYPPAVVQLSQQLKAAQADAVASGAAEISRGTPYWTIRLPKP